MLDGVAMGQTPFTREELEPGRVVHVELWSEGYEHVTRDVRIQAGREEQLRVTLEKIQPSQ